MIYLNYLNNLSISTALFGSFDSKANLYLFLYPFIISKFNLFLLVYFLSVFMIICIVVNRVIMIICVVINRVIMIICVVVNRVIMIICVVVNRVFMIMRCC